MAKTPCKHIKKKNISSGYIDPTTNHITVICLDCGMQRYESSGKESIITSKWFRPRLNK